MRKTALGAALMACLAGLALAVQTPEAEARRLGSFIPASAGPWLSEADEVYDAATAPDGPAGPAALLRSEHLKLAVVRRFVKDGQPDLLVALCDMGAGENARAVFERERGGGNAVLGPGSSYASGLLVFWKGRYFAAVSTEKETPVTRELVLGLGRAIAAAIGEGETKTKGS